MRLSLLARANGWHIGGPGMMKAKLGNAKCQVRAFWSRFLSFLCFFAYVHHVGLAYISSEFAYIYTKKCLFKISVAKKYQRLD